MWKFKSSNNTKYLKQAWEWHNAMPRSFRLRCGFTSEEQFIETLSQDSIYIGLDNGCFTALVCATDTGNGSAEGHLFCPRGSNIDFLAALITFAKTEVLKRFERVIVEIPSRHRTLHGLVLRAGFFDAGLFKMPASQFYIAMR